MSEQRQRLLHGDDAAAMPTDGLPRPQRLTELPGADDAGRERSRQQALWEDPKHWSGPIYFCSDDPRYLVPKRGKYRLGWTINVGHPAGGWSLVGLVVLVPLVTVAVSVGASVAEGCRK